MRLSATYHPIEYLLLQCRKWIPGSLSVQAIFNQSNQIMYFDGEDNHKLDLTSNENAIHLIKIRERKSRYTWVDQSFLAGSTRQFAQLTMDKELEHHYLALFINNPSDQLSDIILIEFPEHVNPFRIKNSSINLSTDDKENLGAVLYSVISSEYERIANENKLLIELSSGMSLLQAELKEAKHALSLLQQQIANDFNASLEYILAQLQVEEKLIIDVLPDTFSVLKEMNLPEGELKSVILRAAHIEMITQPQSLRIKLSPHFLQKSSTSVTNSNVEHKYDKVSALLQRYEEAAAQLVAEKVVINGKNIAKKLMVTPPALTDAVKKNAQRITLLLQNYPEKWRLIRQYLKPIQRIESELVKRA